MNPGPLETFLWTLKQMKQHELENALRSLPQHGSRKKELLLQVCNLEDPETAAPRTGDRWILLPRYWIRMHQNGETAGLGGSSV